MASGHYIRQQISGSLGWPFNASQPLYAHDWLRRYALFANSLLPSVNSQIHSVLFWRNFYLSCFKCLVFFFGLRFRLEWHSFNIHGPWTSTFSFHLFENVPESLSLLLIWGSVEDIPHRRDFISHGYSFHFRRLMSEKKQCESGLFTLILNGFFL